MKKHLIFVLVLSVFTFLSCDQKEKRTVGKKTDQQKQTDTSTISDQIKDSLKRINEDIIADPNNPNLYYKRALFYQDLKNVSLAIEDMLRVTKLDSTNADYQLALGEMYFISNQPSMAKSQFEKAIELDEKNTDALLKLAEIELILRNYDEMFGLINRALRIDESLERGYFMKGMAYKEIGDSAKAVSSFQTARELKSDNYAANMEIGMLLAASKKESAFEYFEAALVIKPKSTEALYHKGKFAQDLHKLDTAITCYEEIIEIDPSNSLAYYNLGYIQLVYGSRKDDYLEAIKNFNLALTHTPEYVEAYYNRGYAYEQLGELDKAERDYRVALELNPQFDLAAKGLSRLGK